MSEPRILTPTDRATIRQRWQDGRPGVSRAFDGVDVLAMLDTCDAMHAVIRSVVDAAPDLIYTHGEGDWWLGVKAFPPAEAAVLDTIRKDHTDGLPT